MLEIMASMGIGIWCCLGLVLVISSIESLIHDIRREKRDIEYHRERMKNLK